MIDLGYNREHIDFVRVIALFQHYSSSGVEPGSMSDTGLLSRTFSTRGRT